MDNKWSQRKTSADVLFMVSVVEAEVSLSVRTVRRVDRQDTALKRRDLAAILCFRGPEEGVASVP